jgi:pyrimidine operon attenuation protein/uracil phosphoribosyltransferase
VSSEARKGDLVSKVVLQSTDIERCLFRIAREILEDQQLTDDSVLIGIHSRGVPLALRLASNIAAAPLGRPVPVGALDIAMFRDDQSLRSKSVQPSTIPVPSLEGRPVVLVDDVLYTGRSVRAALDALGEFGRPSLVRLAVLVDRGHRELPIRADFVGKNLPSSKGESIKVRVREFDGIDEVSIVS